MDLLTTKQLKEKIGIDDRFHKENTLKILQNFSKAKDKFEVFKSKINKERERIILGYNELVENKNKDKEILFKEIEGLEQRREEMFKPLEIKEEAINLKIKEKKELLSVYQKLEKIVDKKIEDNQLILDKDERAKSYCQMREKNVSIKEIELNNLDNILKSKKNNINNLEKQKLALFNSKNEELENRESEVKRREIIVNSDKEVLRLREIELRHIRIKLQDEREALNRAKQEIYGRR